jgi:diguanylate cyclase (GGDEF)-like protein
MMQKVRARAGLILLAGFGIALVALEVYLLLIQPRPRDSLSPEERQWLRNKGELVFAGDNNYPPFEYVAENGEYRGFNVDMVRALGLELGVDVRLVPMTWAEALEALRQGRVDALQGLKYTSEREKTYAFAQPYLTTSQAIFVKSDRYDIAALPDLARRVVAVQRGDFAHDLLKTRPEVHLLLVENQSDAADQLLEGEADAFVGNRFAGLYLFQRKRAMDQVKMVGEPIAPAGYGPAVRKGDQVLLRLLNIGLESVERKGIKQNIDHKWFGQVIQGQSALPSTFLTLALVLLAITLAGALIIYAWNRTLMDQVRQRTQELSISNQALRQRAEEMAGLYKVGVAATSSLDFHEALTSIYKQISQFMDISTFYIAIYDELEQKLHFEIFVDRGEQRDRFTVSLNENPGLTGWILSSQEPLLIRDLELEKDRLPASFVTVGQPVRSWLGVPLKLKEKLVGVMSIQSYEPNAFDEDSQRIFSTVASQVAMVIENTRLHERIREQAVRDGVTQVYNHDYLHEQLVRELERSKRYHHPVSFIMLDLDQFKELNDHYGHLVGDEVLRLVAKLISTRVRSVDIVGRYGGDEFAIILPQASVSDAQAVAERVRDAVERTPFASPQGDLPTTLTVSQGVATFPDSAQSPVALIDQADRALYAAKTAGRNQIRVASPMS